LVIGAVFNQLIVPSAYQKITGIKNAYILM